MIIHDIIFSYREKAVHKTAVEAMQDHLSSLSEANRVLCDVNDCFITSAIASGPSSQTDSHSGDKGMRIICNSLIGLLYI